MQAMKRALEKSFLWFKNNAGFSKNL